MEEGRKRNSDMSLNEVYFWTSTIVEWKHLLKPDKYKEILTGSLRTLKERQCINIYGFVLMPNHIHIIWELLKMNGKEMPDSSFTKFTAHQFKKDLNVYHPNVLEVFRTNKEDRNYQFWQRDPLAVALTSKDMVLQKLEYVHNNPLNERWNLSDRPENYKWSSSKFYETEIDEFGFLTHISERF